MRLIVRKLLEFDMHYPEEVFFLNVDLILQLSATFMIRFEEHFLVA
jgi:hypothetical protein